MLFEAPREEREINTLFIFWSVIEKDERKDEVCPTQTHVVLSFFIFRKLRPKVFFGKGNFDFSDFGAK